MTDRVPCPRCCQDWLQRVHIASLNIDGILCPECDAFWLKASDIMEPGEGRYGVTWFDYGTFMQSQGRGTVEAAGELPSLGDFLRKN